MKTISNLAEKDYNRGQEEQNQSLMPIEKIKKTTGTAIQVVKQILANERPSFLFSQQLCYGAPVRWGF